VAQDPQANPNRRRERRARLEPRRSPLQERSRARVEAILAATVELLGEQDVDTLTTAHIAQRAEIPIGSVYHYFPSKEGVLAELVARTTHRIDSAFAEHLARDFERLPWQRAIEGAIDAAVAAYEADAAFIAVWRATRGTPLFRDVTDASNVRFAERLSALPMAREIRPLAIQSAIRLANAFLDWVLDTDDPRERARITRELKRAVLAYLEPEFEAKSE
jgi:AcrR family transcriptional regulator